MFASARVVLNRVRLKECKTDDYEIEINLPIPSFK